MGATRVLARQSLARLLSKATGSLLALGQALPHQNVCCVSLTLTPVSRIITEEGSKAQRSEVKLLTAIESLQSICTQS